MGHQGEGVQISADDLTPVVDAGELAALGAHADASYFHLSPGGTVTLLAAATCDPALENAITSCVTTLTPTTGDPAAAFGYCVEDGAHQLYEDLCTASSTPQPALCGVSELEFLLLALPPCIVELADDFTPP